MIKDALDSEGPLMSLLDTLGQLVILGFMWLVGCIPIITIASSSAALYYAVMKSIRCGEGNAFREFSDSYRANLKRGILVTLIALLLAGLLVLNVSILLQTGQGGLIASATVVMAVALAATLLYVGPVLSRFNVKVRDVWKLSFVMAVQFIPYTLVLLASLVVLVLIQFYLLPMAAALLLPGLWCYATTFLIEKALRRYMPPKADGDDNWYYQ